MFECVGIRCVSRMVLAENVAESVECVLGRCGSSICSNILLFVAVGYVLFRV